MNIKKMFCLVVFVCCVFGQGCSLKDNNSDGLSNDNDALDVRRVVVVPVTMSGGAGKINLVDPDNQLAILSMANTYLGQMGYEHVPIKTMLDVLKENKINIQDEKALTASNLKNLFDADAVLYAKIDCSHLFYLVGSSYVVGMDLKLVDLNNGALLWSDHEYESMDSSADNTYYILPVGNALGPYHAILQSIEFLYHLTGEAQSWAKKGSDEYLELSMLCVSKSILTMPRRSVRGS